MSSDRFRSQVKTLDETKRVPGRRKPFISESIIDSDSQRLYLLALFALVQAWKIYDLYVINNVQYLEIAHESTGILTLFGIFSPKIAFIFKYFFLDSAFILIMPFLNIPKLTFTPAVSVLLLIMVNSLTMIMTFTFSISLSSVLFTLYRTIVPEKELSTLETYIDTEAVLRQSDHFKGKKTIRYAPNSSIRINPFDELFCIRPTYKNKVKIPIKVESTFDLQYLQIDYQDFNNDHHILNYTFKDLKSYLVTDYYNSQYAKLDPSVLADSNVKILEIPVEKPGYYSINKAIDRKEKTIRSFKSNTIISVCPEASFVSNGSAKTDMCVDESVENMKITVLGVPPFTLFYEEEINGKLSNLPPTVVFHPDKIDSPLVQSLSRSGQPKSMKFAPQYLKDISWAKSSQITVPLGEKQLKKSGKYIYTVNKIIDGFGNVVEYTPHPEDPSIYASFISHPVPVLKLVDNKPSIPILNDEEKVLDVVVSDMREAQIEGPYEVVFKFLPSNNHSDAEIFTKSFDLTKSKKMSILAKKPGTYSIEKGMSKFCSSKMGSSPVSVSIAKPPKMEVSLDSIVDKCVGTTGLQFNLEFIGSAPFELGYEISRLDPNDSTKVLRKEREGDLTSGSSTLEYNFKPSAEGSYSIEFTYLKDKFHKNEKNFESGKYRYVTYFKQKPRAYFSKNSEIKRFKCCNGASQNVTLMLDGEPPFDVTYNIVAPDSSTETYTIENVMENKIQIQTPNFTLGGDYTLTLKNVTDSGTCDVEFRGQEVHIDVNKELYQLSFEKNDEVKIAQGTNFIIPLNSLSTDKVDLTYSYKPSTGGKEVILSLRDHDPAMGISVNNAGTYRLVSLKSGKCKGQIVQDYEVKVDFFPFPSLRPANIENGLSQISPGVFKKQEICQNEADEVSFVAKGVSPFIVKYAIGNSRGKFEDYTEQVNGDSFTIQLMSRNAGDYQYIIKDLYDATYTEEIIEKLKRDGKYKLDSLSLTQHVAELPSAQFTKNNQRIQTCVSLLDSIQDLEPISIQIDASLPASLKVNIYHETGGEIDSVQFDNIQSSKVDILSVYENLGIGTHVITIDEVIDSKGCISDDSKLSGQVITIQVYDVPKIRHLIEESNSVSDFDSTKEGYYCVGDQISYMLNGVPPFTIDYEFNHKSQEAEIRGNYFKRRAPAAGELVIKSLADSSATGCKVDYANFNRRDLRAVVHDLPSVEIVQGDHIEEDIHEGEQLEIIFKLTGEPPFKLTYIRKELDDSSKIVETEIVEDIMSHEHRILANLEGTYEAIEIQDRYCVARNHKI